MHALLDAVLRAHGDAEQFYAIPEIRSGLQILRRDRRDSLDIDRVFSNLRAEREARQDRKLLRGVMTVDVERRIGLGIAEPLGVLQALIERQPLLLHPRQDVIAGAVEDTVDTIDLGAGKPFAQRLDRRDRRTYRGLEVQGGAGLFGKFSEMSTVLGNQRLVGRHHRLAKAQGGLHRFERRAVGSADQFDQAVDVGVFGKRDRVFRPLDAAQVKAALLCLRARRHRDDLDAPLALGRKRRRLLIEQAHDLGSHGAKTRDTHLEGCDHVQQT